MRWVEETLFFLKTAQSTASGLPSELGKSLSLGTMTATQSAASLPFCQDPLFGPVYVRTHPRARRLTFRLRSTGLWVSVPPRTARAEVLKALEEVRPKLQAQKEQTPSPRWQWGRVVEGECFRLSLQPTDAGRPWVHREAGMAVVYLPAQTDLYSPQTDALLCKVVAQQLRAEAQHILPTRLRQLSETHGLPFARVSVNLARSRWGSCSASRRINLSAYLLLLPASLIDYVLLHELAHTQEMNHGPAFWALLNRLTQGQAQQLRQTLKEVRLPV